MGKLLVSVCLYKATAVLQGTVVRITRPLDPMLEPANRHHEPEERHKDSSSAAGNALYSVRYFTNAGLHHHRG
ncbi:Protein of unknown function [Pyronema omphalodes CBS 100304]|uniref:Uncharacterized protein n=1 Tax=Pyronema omphalodes (strain CBS 100304) TaxID=1076935 RepID=U4LG32_PYROM|nr:Protein of unknown function [Pyronema omphalodes CBS 100304]